LGVLTCVHVLSHFTVIATIFTAAVAASKLKRAVRVSNDKNTDMVMVGGREPLIVDYEVGFDDSGVCVLSNHHLETVDECLG